MNWLSIVFGIVQLAPEILKLIAQVQLQFSHLPEPQRKAIVMAALPASTPAPIVAEVSRFVDTAAKAQNHPDEPATLGVVKSA